jgi:WD40 repeat protein
VLGSIAGALLVFAAVVAVLAVWALHQRDVAQQARTEAQRQASDATSLALTSSATTQLSSRPDLSLLLAFAAYREKPRAEARSSVLAALMAARGSEAVRAILRGHSDGVLSVVFSPDGRTLASASDDRTVRLWDTRTHKQLGTPLRGKDPFLDVAFTPDGRMLASTSDDHTIRLWDTHTHKQLGTPLRGHEDPVNSVAFTRDGRTLASTSDDRTVRLWDTHTHKQLGAPLRGHSGLVVDAAFSPDGRTLASASSDQTIRLWDTHTHKQLGTALRGHEDWVRSVAFSPNGRTLASASDDETIRLWVNILWRNVHELQTEVCKLVGSGLSKIEWAQYATGIRYRQSCP